MALVLTLALAGCGRGPEAGPVPGVGQAFPAGPVRTLEGRAARLPLAGRHSLVNVWGTWCAPCRRELPALQRLAERLPAGWQVLGLSVDREGDAVQEYLLDRGVRYPNFLDPGRTIAEGRLALPAYPATFLVGPQGRILWGTLGARRWDAPGVPEALEAVARGEPGARRRLEALLPPDRRRAGAAAPFPSGGALPSRTIPSQAAGALANIARFP
ncbi:MAG: TlpA family protein disulfide reductase, partial [Gammaproteobacteria bacterium]